MVQGQGHPGARTRSQRQEEANTVKNAFQDGGQHTLREYHEFFVREDGTLFARYSGSCDECNYAIEWDGEPKKVDP